VVGDMVATKTAAVAGDEDEEEVVCGSRMV
jgi:hypothetical protein